MWDFGAAFEYLVEQDTAAQRDRPISYSPAAQSSRPLPSIFSTQPFTLQIQRVR